MPRIVLDYNNMLAPRLGGRGIEPAALEGMAERFREAHADTLRRRDSGEMGFFSLTQEDDTVASIEAFAEGAGQAFSDFVVLGIGGSALGMIALRSALLKPSWNELSDEERDFFPRIHVLDNVDPATIGPVPRPAGLGAHPVQRRLQERRHGGDDVAVPHRPSAAQEKLGDGYRRTSSSPPIPRRASCASSRSRRTSPRSPSRPAWEGASPSSPPWGCCRRRWWGSTCASCWPAPARWPSAARPDDLRANPAGLFAVLQYLADTEADAPIHVMMPYSDRLRDVADWFRQLWAESLGKQSTRGGDEVFAGPTPGQVARRHRPALAGAALRRGAVRQDDHLLAEAEREIDVEIPSVYPELGELGYLGGHTLGGLLRTEMLATEAALARRGRMNMMLELPRVDARSLGGVFMLFQIATVYAGHLYGVDPLDQPGVELGKQLTYGIMGRAGFEAQRGEWEGREPKRDDWTSR
jgi:glucose-6-phosphate isomerase